MELVPVHPNYAVFFGMDDLDGRVARVETALHVRCTLARRIDASFLDDVFYRLNPRNNKNETTFIYRFDRQD